MDIYFDESRNTGEISLNGNVLNYTEQRYFVLVGYIEDETTNKKYQRFKKKWLSHINSNNPSIYEIKGNDLMRKDNTDIRNDFIEKFCYGDNLYITVYDKKFFVVTQMINWLVYRFIDYGGEARDLYYNLSEFLIKVDEAYLGKYISVTKSNTRDSIEEFVRYIIDYEYKECINSPYEIELANLWRGLIKHIMLSDEDYCEELRKDNVPNDRVKGKDRNNIVNLTCLGETILLVKKNNPNLKNTQLKIHHDEIETVQEYIQANWEYENLEFVNSTHSLQVQISDNISSIVGNLIKQLLPIFNDNDLLKVLNNDYEWIKATFRSIFNRINQRNTKFVISMREMAVIKSILSNKDFSSLNNFKEDIMIRLKSRIETEKGNHVDQSDAAEILGK